MQEKTKSYLVLKPKQDVPFIQKIVDQLANQEALLELAALEPFLDEYGVLRSDSRLGDIEHIAYNVK